MKPITAAQARDMSPKREANIHLAQIFEAIEKAAKADRTTTRFPYVLTEIRGEGSVSPKGEVGTAVVKMLEGLGYRIESHWDCGQFVDAYLTVEWGE